jgi:DNA-binding response OmpR family regulator
MDIRPLILAVDDDAHILQIIKWELTAQDCQVITCRSGEEALEIAREQRPDLIILDLMMPKLDGLEVLRRLRERSSVPVLLLTARTRDQDKIGGLDTGADDYVTKPFSPEELSSRVKAILRRGPREDSLPGTIVRNGDVEIDLGRRRVRRNGADVSLTRTEWTLLEHLATNAGKVMTISDLLTKIWSIEYLTDAQYLRVWISRLRTKLGDEKPHRLIKTFTGIGYMLNPGPEPEDTDETDAEPSASARSHDEPVDVAMN